MTYTEPVNASDLEVHVAPGCSHAAVYQNGNLVDRGEYDEVQERLIEALGVMVEHGSDPIIDRTARGWGGFAETLGDLNAARAAG